MTSACKLTYHYYMDIFKLYYGLSLVEKALKLVFCDEKRQFSEYSQVLGSVQNYNETNTFPLSANSFHQSVSKQRNQRRYLNVSKYALYRSILMIEVLIAQVSVLNPLMAVLRLSMLPKQ